MELLRRDVGQRVVAVTSTPAAADPASESPAPPAPRAPSPPRADGTPPRAGVATASDRLPARCPRGPRPHHHRFVRVEHLPEDHLPRRTGGRNSAYAD